MSDAADSESSNTAEVTTGAGSSSSAPTLVVEPGAGPPGFVATALGKGFTRNALVLLGWSAGAGSSIVRTSAAGSFSASMLVFRDNAPGPRELLATPTSSADARSFARLGPYSSSSEPTTRPPDFIGRR